MLKYYALSTPVRHEDYPTWRTVYVAAGGFTQEFQTAARASREHVYLWTLPDLYKPAGRPKKRSPAAP